MGKKHEPLVSICIPAFNGGKFIHRALESLIHQSYKNIEIVVADDASTDNTSEIVRRYASKDKRIVYFRNNSNLGGIRNSFKAIEIATGNYIQVLCHDDWFSENCVEESVKAFQLHPQIGMVLPQVISFDLKDNKIFSPRRIFIAHGGIYSTEPLLKYGYKFQLAFPGELALLGGSALYRREDLIDIKPFMLEIVESPDYPIARDFGFWGAALIPLKILSKYRSFMCNTSSACVLAKHLTSYGGGRNDDISSRNISVRVKRFFAIRGFYERIYANELKRFLPHFRLGFGAQETADLLLAFARGRFKNSSLKEILQGVSLVWGDYSSSERFWIATNVPLIIFTRILQYAGQCLKKACKREKKFVNYYPRIFLDKGKDATASFKFDPPALENQ